MKTVKTIYRGFEIVSDQGYWKVYDPEFPGHIAGQYLSEKSAQEFVDTIKKHRANRNA